MVYFPTEKDWTLTTRPNRIPLDERFPKHLAVNNLKLSGQKFRRPVVRLPNSRNASGSNPSQTQNRQHPERRTHENDDPVSRYLNRTEPNLVPLGRGREEGELSDMAEPDSLLDRLDNAFVEGTLNWEDEPSSMTKEWNEQPTGW